jgi:hypothetical protein
MYSFMNDREAFSTSYARSSMVIDCSSMVPRDVNSSEQR